MTQGIVAPGITTLAQAVSYVKSNRRKGVKCPCCDRFVKIYARGITGAMAYVLIKMVDHDDRRPGEWVHLPTFVAKLEHPSISVALHGDPAKLAYWNFIEQHIEERADGCSRNGHWRATEAGRQFAYGNVAVPRKALVLSGGGLLGLDTTVGTIDVYDALGTAFNYNELMST